MAPANGGMASANGRGGIKQLARNDAKVCGDSAASQMQRGTRTEHLDILLRRPNHQRPPLRCFCPRRTRDAPRSRGGRREAAGSAAADRSRPLRPQDVGKKCVEAAHMMALWGAVWHTVRVLAGQRADRTAQCVAPGALVSLRLVLAPPPHGPCHPCASPLLRSPPPTTLPAERKHRRSQVAYSTSAAFAPVSATHLKTPPLRPLTGRRGDDDADVERGRTDATVNDAGAGR